jgi:hypothetical protein
MSFLFSIIILSKNIKIYLNFCNHIKNTRTSLFIALVYFMHLLFVNLFYLLYLFRNLVLDNHSVELGTQDKEFVLQVAWQEWKEIFRLFPKSSIFTLSHPCEEIYSCNNTLHLESQLGTLACRFIGTPIAECCSKSSFPHEGNSGLISNSRGTVKKSLVVLLPATCKTIPRSCVPNSTEWLSNTSCECK